MWHKDVIPSDFDDLVVQLLGRLKEMTIKTKVREAFRLVSSLIAVFLIVGLLSSAALNAVDFYMLRLETSRVDVAAGLYSALRTSVSSSDVLSDRLGAGLTASQINILAEYAEKEVQDAPQYITSTFRNWCAIFYSANTQWSVGSNEYNSKSTNVSVTEKNEGKRDVSYIQKRGSNPIATNKPSKRYNVTVKCTEPEARYTFDYRNILYDSGLEIVLDYAYGDDNGMSQEYNKFVSEKAKIFRSIPSSLIFSALANCFLIALLIANNLQKDKSSTTAKILKQLSSLIALAAYVASVYAIIGITVVCLQFKRRIRIELSAFGIALHLGSSWFSMLWSIYVFQSISMIVWCGPIWCSAPRSVELEHREEEFPLDSHSLSASYIEDSTPTINDFKNFKTPFVELTKSLSSETIETARRNPFNNEGSSRGFNNV